MLFQRPVPSSEGRRIVICDYNALLLSVTGLLRMSDYCVFQAHDGLAAEELCMRMPDIALLVLNTYGTGIEVGSLVRRVRTAKPGIQVLHIGSSTPPSPLKRFGYWSVKTRHEGCAQGSSAIPARRWRGRRSDAART